ncbi:bifunctional diguanylate cyclase/phosphodiesterase [Antrihabitans sp. YC2-6]|uniref:putative bifunctional diguanylate cyclase/phosphodiesterase n=1 Tax=Antrihabitans sp. YC2-6 TaxID=2799498 RepID=UPI0018F305B1|nr:EAL domain-containing protein [Antrihabitans sp. YC2-6]MBJ8343789.1 EAL domain-containing protein [Antrihabitans sp. YC2-6]
MHMRGMGGLRNAWLQAPSALATPSLMGRITGMMFVVAGVHGVFLVTMAEVDRWTPVLYGATSFAVVLGCALFLWGYRMSMGHYEILVAFGTLTLVMGVYLLADDTAAVAGSTFFLYIGCAAALFLPWTRNVLQMAFAATCCLVALGARPGLYWWAGVTPAAATIMIGCSVGVLSRFASDANKDSLTGLLNRRGFDRQLGYFLAEAGRTKRRPVVVLFDLDRFKWLNDAHGHHAGDALLRQVGDAWRDVVDETHILARYGGDEFALLLPESTEDDAVALSKRMRRSISMSCSAGVTSWLPGESGSLLVRRADLALYRAKQAGGSVTMLESMRPSALAAELREAIAHNEVGVKYAAIVRLDGDTSAVARDVVGVEALVRWRSRIDPAITPMETIRIAEGNDLIAALDRLVLERACAEVAALEGVAGPLNLHVNVSGRELAETSYVASVQDVLARTGWPAGRLVIEVQESVLDYDTPAVIRNMQALRECGVRIALDDFGSGSSSLSKLETLPIDFAKVHRKFVGSITPEKAPSPLLGAIAALGDAMDLPVIARGVENVGQAEALTERGYRFAQGSYFGECTPAVAFGR